MGSREECQLSYITGSLSAMWETERASETGRKKTAVPTVTASLCPLGQDLSCAHSTKPAEGTAHTERKMSKVIRVCVG